MNVAIVLSGGSGKRMGTDIPKQYLSIAGKPVIVHTILQLQSCEEIEYIIVTAAGSWHDSIIEWREQYGLYKLREIAPAGADRQLSILNGLLAARPYMTDETAGVLVQDAVRPMASRALIHRLLCELRGSPAVMPAVPVTDTVYASRDGVWVDGLMERSTLFAGQAPEAFRYWDYLKLYQETPIDELCSMSGSSQLPQSRGWRIKMVPGEQSNIKLTHPIDIDICEKLLQERGEQE